MSRELRSDLPPMPKGIAALPIGPNGYPVPWFVKWIEGKPEFRVMDGAKLLRAVHGNRCWTCGRPLGKELSFVVGPMCAVTRISAEPPSHPACAAYSVRACPFLSRPGMRRREAGMPVEAAMDDGVAITRNPGVALIWSTRSYQLIRPKPGMILFRMGLSLGARCYAEGRPATKEEITESVRSGLPTLYEMASKQSYSAVRELPAQTSLACMVLGIDHVEQGDEQFSSFLERHRAAARARALS